MTTLLIRTSTSGDRELWVGTTGRGLVRLFAASVTSPDTYIQHTGDNRYDFERWFGPETLREAFHLRCFIDCMLYSDGAFKELDYIHESLTALIAAVKAQRAAKDTKREPAAILNIVYEIDDLLARVNYPCTYSHERAMELKQLEEEKGEEE